MGPLKGLKILEFAGLGPTPFCGMLLSDMGADVVRIDRPDAVELGLKRPVEMQITRRGRRSVILDLKTGAGVETALQLAAAADGLIEGFRPGVMERLGLGPEACMAANPRLVYGRMTGWGQDGPLANAAGHDINYIALTGVLSCIGPAGHAPTPPLNLVGDYGGGAMFLAFGMVCGLLEAARSKMGQVVDAAMVDGAATLATGMFADLAGGLWRETREANIVDGGAPFYAAYETADGKFVSIASVEERFYRELLSKLGLADTALPDRLDRSGWPTLRDVFARTFKSKTQAEWITLLHGSDVCFAPVLTPTEALADPHLNHRHTFCQIAGVTQPAPAPRFSRTPGIIKSPPAPAGAGMHAALADWGFDPEAIERIEGRAKWN